MLPDDLLVKLLVANHGAKHFPVLLGPESLVQVIGSSIKTAYTLPSLVRLTSKWSINRSRRCRVSPLRREGKFKRYLYRVHCSEGYSKGPHICRIQVQDGDEDKPLRDRQILVSCSCEFWMFWGPDYNARTKGYLEGKPRTNVMPQGVRDPQKQNWICKHIAAAAQDFYKEDPPEQLEPPPRRPGRPAPPSPRSPIPSPRQPRQPRQFGRPV